MQLTGCHGNVIYRLLWWWPLVAMETGMSADITVVLQ